MGGRDAEETERGRDVKAWAGMGYCNLQCICTSWWW